MPNPDSAPAIPSAAIGLGKFASVGYLLALGLLGPFLVIGFDLWGSRSPVGTALWRYGAFGMLINAQFYFMLAAGFAAAAAAIQGRRAVLMVVAVASAILMLVVAVWTPFFFLDFLQIRRGMAPVLAAQVRQAAIAGLFQAVLGLPIYLAIILGALKAWKTLRTAANEQQRPKAPALVGGR